MNAEPPGAEIRLARHAMATRFEIWLHGQRVDAMRAAAEEAFDGIVELDRLLSLYRPESDLSLINREACSRAVRVDPRVFKLLERAKTLSLGTRGAFDPSVAPVLFQWGVIGGRWRIPGEDELREALSKVGMQSVELDSDEGSVRYARPGMWLDLGSIAKGYALECAAETLRNCGIESALIHGGTSSVCGLGRGPDGLPWSVAVRPHNGEDSKEKQPLVWFRTVAGAHTALSGPVPPPPKSFSSDEVAWPKVQLEDAAMSVTGIRGKCFELEGKVFGHVIDPRFGRPAQTAAMAIVKGHSATDADALSTALLVLGREGAGSISSHFPGYELWLGDWG